MKTTEWLIIAAVVGYVLFSSNNQQPAAVVPVSGWVGPGSYQGICQGAPGDSPKGIGFLAPTKEQFDKEVAWNNVVQITGFQNI